MTFRIYLALLQVRVLDLLANELSNAVPTLDVELLLAEVEQDHGEISSVVLVDNPG